MNEKWQECERSDIKDNILPTMSTMTKVITDVTMMCTPDDPYAGFFSNFNMPYYGTVSLKLDEVVSATFYTDTAQKFKKYEWDITIKIRNRKEREVGHNGQENE